MKILLLEDNATDAGLTIRTLNKEWPNSTIDHANCIRNAMTFLTQKKDYDIALLDMQLPDGNGIDVLMAIRETFPKIAVVMLTGSGDEEVAVAALKAGADDYMVKKSDYIPKIPRIAEYAIVNHKQYLERESTSIRLLYIEHNAADVDFTKRHLKRYSPFIQLDNVPTGEEALKVLPESSHNPSEQTYNVILMDYRLPGMSALELIKTIRQEKKLDIPIIIVTGQGNEEIAVQALKVGADEYLVKRENYITRLPSLILGAYQHIELSRKQKELKESETKYRLLAENSSDVIFTLDFNLNYTYVSPAIIALRGYTQEEVMKSKLEEALTPSSYKKVSGIVEKILPGIIAGDGTVEPIVIEVEMIKKDNSTIWTEVNASVFVDENGFPIGILGVTRDISKRKEAQEELRKLSRAVIQSPTSIMITDKEGYIEYVNPRFTKLTGFGTDEVFGKKPNILRSGVHNDRYYKDLWSTITLGHDWIGEFQNKKKNGELFWVQTVISPLVDENGEITHFVAVNEDITERKKIIEDLREAKEKAEESNRLKTAFLANMSHEIRTPMNGILGFLDLLNTPQLSDEEKDMYTGIVNESGQRLLKTINNIIEISKIEAGQTDISLSEVNLHNILEYHRDFFMPEAEKKGLTIIMGSSMAEPKVIITDKYKLDSILINLINNAIKFTNKGFIEIGLKLDKNSTTIYVKDTGVGIPYDRREAVFESFVQSDLSMTRAHEGSGLGLSICNAYAKMLNGQITVNSEVGEGTTFYVMLPC